ncbi:MAG: DUF1616 domain-containing protein [Halosimplex sp.]
MSYDTTPRWRSVADLAALVAVVLAFDAVVGLGVDATALRLALGLPVLLLAPGWAVVAALYPRGGARLDPGRPRAAVSPNYGPSTEPISSVVRLGLSVVASVAVVAAVGLAVNFTPWRIRAVPVLAGLTLVTRAAAGAAAARRFSVPSQARYSPGVSTAALASALRPRFSAAFVLGLVLVASVVAATGALAATGAPAAATNEDYTEFAALTANGTGEYVTANYTAAIAAGRPVYFEVANDEGERTDYSLVLAEETVAREGGDAVVESATVVDRRTVTVASGDTRYLEYDPNPPETDASVRLRAYLYRGDAPSEPSAGSAYRTLQVWYDEDPLATTGNATSG